MLPSLFENLKDKVECSTLNDENLAKTVDKTLILVSKLNENNNEETLTKTDDNVNI